MPLPAKIAPTFSYESKNISDGFNASDTGLRAIRSHNGTCQYSGIFTSLNSHAGRTIPSGVKNLKNAALILRKIS